MISSMPIDGQPLPQDSDVQDTVLTVGGTDVDTQPRSAVSPIRRLFGENLLAKAGFVLTRFPVGLFWFLVIVIGLSLGFGLAIVGIGIVILGGLFYAFRGGARAERLLIGSAGGPRIEQPYRLAPEGAGMSTRLRIRLGDPATYRDLLYLLLLFPIGVIAFAITTVTLTMTFGAIASPLFYNRFGSDQIVFGDASDPWYVVDRLWEALVLAVIGFILLPLVPLMIRVLSAANFGIASFLLGPTKSTEVAQAHKQRDLGLSADMTERKRIERDLHDGAQQRLVAMTMELGRARAKMDDDPDSAKELLDSANDHAKAAMQELRDLARGISPPLLSDRGLDAALSALAARSPIPVDLTVQLDRRLPESAESTAYFVIAESMTNAIKHSKAKVITVRVMDHKSRLSVSVSDNGLGGVDPTGSGIVGLADRVRSVGGDFMARNRDGGAAGGGFAGVEILAEIPCGS